MPHHSLNLAALAQGEHGGDAAQVAAQAGIAPGTLLDFSSNSFVQAHDITRKIVAGISADFDCYPDSTSFAFCTAAAAFEQCAPEEILAGNGSAELIWLALLCLRPRRVALISPVFSEYRRACEGLGISYTVVTPPDSRVQWWPAAHDIPPDTDVIVLCSPNNPGGHSCGELAPLLQQLLHATKAVVFLDMAYRDFLESGPLHTRHHWSFLRQAVGNDRLICLHSMTKFYCCTGIRLGYLTAAAALLRSMATCRASWMVNAFAENTGLRLLEQYEDFRARLPQLYADRSALAQLLTASPLFTEILTGPSFCIARVNTSLFATAGLLRAALVQQRILVRDCDSIPGMPPGWVRIQARQGSDLQRLEAAVRELESGR